MRSRWLGVLFFVLTAAAATPTPAQLTCDVSAAVAPTLRHEGVTELTGDIVLDCSGMAPEGGISDNLTVFLNTTVTSKLLGGASEALLLVNEPAAGTQVLGTNLFEGIVSGNSVTFTGIPFAPAPGGMISHRILRITNIRVDASGLAVGPQLPAQVVASLSVSGAVSVPLNNPVQVVGFVQDALAVSLQCSPAGTVGLRFDELFPTAFKTQGGTGQSTPGTIYNTESGFTPDPIIAGVGTADTGTELGAAVSGLPAGTQLSVPASITEGSLTIVAVDPPGGGPVPIMNGAATIVYEVTAATALQSEGITIPVTVSGPPLGGVTVRGNLYPISTQSMASASAPIPRFADVSTEMPLGKSCSQAPLLSPWSLLGLALGLLGVGVFMVRRSLWQ